ncbi:ABC transporter ATP-binding protein [Amycolatopsis sp. A1MSW2902]|uniref:ABC transporter ATP-binding protein n=1 Tax=Amycolatopsis sp. A1MSW2902 TaxID=687413 RepID=UPI00307E8A48
MTAGTDQRLVEPGAIMEMLAPVRGRLKLGVLLAALSVPCSTLAYVATAEIIAALLRGSSAGTVWLWAGLGVAGAVARVVIYNVSLSVCHYADADFRHATRTRIARHLSRVGLGWFERVGSGTVKRTVSDDVHRMHTIVAHVATDLTTAVLAPVLALAYLFVVNWVYALVLLGWLLLVVACTVPAMNRDHEKHVEEWNHAMSGLTRATVELADGIEVVKTYGSAARPVGRFAAAVEAVTTACVRWMAVAARPTTVLTILVAPATMIVLLLATGLVLVSQGAADPAAVAAFLVVGVGIPTSPQHIASLRSLVREGQLAATHVQRVLAEPWFPEPANPKVPEGHRIEFSEVRFGYDEGTEVLHGIDLTLEPGTVTALVGPSGSGKTTLARLLPRFFDVGSGAIRVGGVDVRDIGTPRLLSSMAIVFQDVVLLRDTIRENIRIGCPGATDEQVLDAARRAQIHDVVENCPDGYDTVLGTGSGGLSGGEKQRLTIARAILGKPPIVVLDEATAHADPHSEAAVQQALAELAKGSPAKSTAEDGPTMLVIAHRLHTIMHADQIVVLDEGRIAERGRHQELLAVDGLYARLWRAQQPAPRAADETRAASDGHREVRS